MAYQDIVGDEEIGAREIIGAMMDIVGGKDGRLARLQRRQGRREERPDNSILTNRLGRLLGKVNGSEQVVSETPEVLRNFPMPIGTVTMAAGAADQLQNNAQRTIRIQRLVLSSSDLANFVVTGISLGVEQQFAALGSAPAEAYAYNAVGTSFRGTTLAPGCAATVNLAYVASSGTATITGQFSGEALQF